VRCSSDDALAAVLLEPGIIITREVVLAVEESGYGRESHAFIADGPAFDEVGVGVWMVGLVDVFLVEWTDSRDCDANDTVLVLALA